MTILRKHYCLSLGQAYTVVRLKIDESQLRILVSKILGQFAFLIQRELIDRFPTSFSNRIQVIKEASAWIIGSNYDILKFYDQGTKPHDIEPKVKNALAFLWPKGPSIPGQPGKGGKFLFKKVRHPGTKGKHIIEELENDKRLLQSLLDRAIRNVAG